MFKATSRFIHLFKIQYKLLRYGLGQHILQAPWLPRFSLWRLLIYLNLGYWLSSKNNSRGQALRYALESLGPIFVKFGQALSTRPDVIPEDMADELAMLQDRVPPFSSEKAIAMIESIYGKSLTQIFAEFNPIPLASASIAQVHSAVLLNGKKVVVKVLRPNIEKVIHRDLDLLFMIADVVQSYSRDAKRLRLSDVVAEFEKTILDELDFTREAANASQLRRNFLNSPLLYVPEIDWPLVRQKVLVQERVSGIPVSDIERLKAQNIDLKKLAENGVEIFFTQVFRDCFFHADMHPGNIFVSGNRYIAVDFGIMGSLNRHDQYYLAENFLAFFRRDYRRVAELHIESGWVPYDTRVDEFEAAIRTVCEPIFERPLKEISYGQVLYKLFQTGQRFKMTVQPQLILLQKTLLQIEGLGRFLYPDLDLWHTAKPFLENWLKRRVSFRAQWRRLKIHTPYLAEKLPDLPVLLTETLNHIRHQQLKESTIVINKEPKRLFQLGQIILLFALGLITGVIASHYVTFFKH